MEEQGINWRGVLSWFCGETQLLQPNAKELSRDRDYRPACAIAFLCLLVGLLLSILLRTCLGKQASWGLFALSVMPFQVFALGGCLLALLPIVRRDGFKACYDIPSQPESFGAMLKACLRFLLLIYPVILVINAFSVYFCRLLGIPMTKQVLESLGHDGGLWYWLISGISTAVMAPVAEEVLVRLVLYRTLRSIVPLWAEMLSSLVFGLMHGHPQYILSLFFVGMCLQRARAMGGLPQAILLHSLYNLLALLFLFFHLR